MEDQVPELRNVDCIRMYVPDIEAGLLFYRYCLGHQLVWRTEDSVGLRMPDSDTEIVLHTKKRQPPEIDIKVQSADDAAKRIREAGGKIIKPPFDIGIGRCAVMAYSQHTPLELHPVLQSNLRLLAPLSEESGVLIASP